MRSTYASCALYSLALGAVSLAYLSDLNREQDLEFGSYPPVTRILARSSDASCRLPVGQQVKAVKAFREMLPVFRHPRCFNCHGGFDITSESHKGSDLVPSGLDPRALLTVEQRQELHENCDVCHTEIRGTLKRPTLKDTPTLAGWMVAPQPMLWNGKGDERLCLDLKKFEEVPDSFVSHIQTDHGEVQFVEAAFHGVRALSPQVRTEEGIVAEPPPGNQRDLVAKARKWVQLLDGHWKEEPGSPTPSECGCVMPKIKLGIDHRIVLEVPNGLPSREESHVQFEVKLEPTGDPRINMFAGEHTLTREIRMTLPQKCTGKAARRERWMVYALVDSTGSIKVRHTAIDDEPKGEIVCKQGGGTARMGTFPGHVSLVNWEAVIPADSGSSKTLEAKGPGQREALTLTVLELPPGQ